MRSLGSWSAQITKAGDESKSFPIQQFMMNGRVGDAYIAAPYGMHYNLPADQPALNISPDGTILLGIDPIGRIKVEAGEVVFYHPITKSKIHFKNNHDIDIETETDINAVCDKINVTAATKATVTAPESEFIGNVTITGNLTVTGATALSGTATSNGKDISDTHGHAQANDSGGNSEANINGVL